MKSVTGDPERIEKVLERVNSLVLDLETTRFDPYDPACRYSTQCDSCLLNCTLYWLQYAS